MADQEFDYGEYINVPREVEQIQLISDPTLRADNYFFALLTDIQNLRERFATVSYRAMWNKTQCETKAAEAKHAYEKKRDQLLATTTFPAAIKSQELRLAQIHQDMDAELTTMHQANMSLLKAETFHKMFVHCNIVLNSKHDTVKTQLEVFRMTMFLDPSLRDEMKTKGGLNP